ncbi:MAG: tetratricopeptide repeat protein [Pseudomonadota bacterium]
MKQPRHTLFLVLLLPLPAHVTALDLTELDAEPPTEDQQVPVAPAEDDSTAADTGVASAPANDIANDEALPVGDDVPNAGLLEAESAVAGDSGGEEISDEDRLLEEFDRFKDLMSNGSIDAADTVAKRVVELAIRSKGPRSTETAKALTNLGIVQHRNEQFDAAVQNFEGAVEILEDNYDRLNTQLVNPLKGLAAAQLSNQRPDLALRTYSRAVHITHVNEGPHNMDQVELLESVAETNLRLGFTDEARDAHEKIYSLNERYHRSNMLALVPSLVRRAQWQHRTGYFNDERTTYRRVIRILEDRKGKNDTSLIEPLMQLGRSYDFVDTHATSLPQAGDAFNAEIYFKRAVRIAENSEDIDWMQLADTKLALADYQMKKQSSPSARKGYREVWELLSAGDERLEHRALVLENPNLLRRGDIPKYAGEARQQDRIASDVDLREGKLALRYTVTTRGKVTGLELIEFEPPEFRDMLREAQREVRTRFYRPRFADGQPVDTGNQVVTHSFYYRQDELEALRSAAAADD